jgi:7-cyano-7-deazaguanine synthase in queuosine biosynthesis
MTPGGTEYGAGMYRSGWFRIPGSERRPLRLGYEAHLDGHAVIGRLSCDLPPVAADLLEIAAMTYAADRLVPRPSEREWSDGSNWGRQLWLQVPVRNPSLWSSVTERLTGLLGWLTDDVWTIEFSQLAHGAGPLDNRQGFLFNTVPRGSPCALFSGGLDSALGLAQDLRSSGAIVVSVDTNNRMKAAQRRIVRALEGDGSTTCVQLQYRVSLREPERENSQRTRGLLFLATGIATAWALGQDRLRVYENGIGAINLPYLRSQEGAQATRSMHPRTLRMAGDLASAVSGRSFKVEAPYLLLTKAEAVRAVPQMKAAVIAAAVSCGTAFAARVAGAAQCGTCTSCLLRRQALIAGGRSDADELTQYRTRSPAGTRELAAMIWQLERLRNCLGKTDQWQGIVSEFPPIMDAECVAPAQLTRLYGAYVREWQAVDLASFGLSGDRSAALCETKSDQS